MKIFRTDLPIEIIILLAILTVLFAIAVIPLLVIIGFIWLVRRVLAGPALVGRHPGEAARANPHSPDDAVHGNGGASGSGDDSIECEVISARTFDENGQEIR
jgi:hypothetical protein